MMPVGGLPHARRSPLTDPLEPLFLRETADTCNWHWRQPAEPQVFVIRPGGQGSNLRE